MRFSKTATGASGTERPSEAGAREARSSEAPEGQLPRSGDRRAIRPMGSRSHLIRNATIAALVGSAVGAGAGLWSVRDGMTSVAVSPISIGGDVAASSASPLTDPANGRPARDPTARDGLSNSTAVATKGVGESTAPAAVVRSDSARNDSQKLVQLARALAEVPDVYALIALRENVSRRADERGEKESPATLALIREIDRNLAEARRLRLKRDGEALRRD